MVSQGALQKFRERLIASGLDRRLLERTVELAKSTKEFDWKKVPKELHVAVDSRPLEGAGRVEDTINLLGHAARKIVMPAAKLMELPVEAVVRQAQIPVALYASTKAALDRDWSDRASVVKLSKSSWLRWIRYIAGLSDPAWSMSGLLQRYIEAIAQIRAQDTEQDERGGTRIKQGVAEDRRVSIEEPEMRHGRKSKSKRFNGYKQHVATDLHSDLILACAVTPANRPEEESTPQLKADLELQDISIGRLYIDRGYINSELVADVQRGGGEILCKPWLVRSQSSRLVQEDRLQAQHARQNDHLPRRTRRSLRAWARRRVRPGGMWAIGVSSFLDPRSGS